MINRVALGGKFECRLQVFSHLLVNGVLRLLRSEFRKGRVCYPATVCGLAESQLWTKWGFLQFPGVQIHDGKGPVVDTLAAIGVVVIVGTVSLRGRDRARGEQRFGKHVLVTDNRRPRREALELDQEVVTRLRISVRDLGFRGLLAKTLPLCTTSRLATVLVLRGGGLCSGRVGGRVGGGLNRSRLLAFRGSGRLFHLGVGFGSFFFDFLSGLSGCRVFGLLVGFVCVGVYMMLRGQSNIVLA